MMPLTMARRSRSVRVRLPLWFTLVVAVLLALLRAVTPPETRHPRARHAPRPAVTYQVPLEATVEWVADGDTVRLTNGELVRYIGIDSPELHHPYKPVQPFAREARDANERLVLHKRVRLEFDAEQRDRYGRLLAYVYLEDGTFVNAELMREGWARTLTIRPNTSHAEEFHHLEDEARAARRGLWALEPEKPRVIMRSIRSTDPRSFAHA